MTAQARFGPPSFLLGKVPGTTTECPGAQLDAPVDLLALGRVAVETLARMDHPVGKRTHCAAAGGLAQEGEDAVDQAGKARCDQAGPETGRGPEMLPIALADRMRMSGKEFHLRSTPGFVGYSAWAKARQRPVSAGRDSAKSAR